MAWQQHGITASGEGGRQAAGRRRRRAAGCGRLSIAAGMNSVRGARDAQRIKHSRGCLSLLLRHCSYLYHVSSPSRHTAPHAALPQTRTPSSRTTAAHNPLRAPRARLTCTTRAPLHALRLPYRAPTWTNMFMPSSSSSPRSYDGQRLRCISSATYSTACLCLSLASPPVWRMEDLMRWGDIAALSWWRAQAAWLKIVKRSICLRQRYKRHQRISAPCRLLPSLPLPSHTP